MKIVRTAALASVAPAAFMATAFAVTPEQVDQARKARDRSQAHIDPMLRRSKDSASMLDYWDKVDAIVDGIEAMRLAGDEYLPKFADEQPDEYKYRLKCTKLTNVYRDIVESLSQKPFEQEVALAADEGTTVPEPLEEFTENVDGSGNNLTMFAAATFFNGINSAIDWIFVDHPKADPNIRTVADAKAAGVRPYWSHVLGRNVLDPRSKMIGGNETLTYVKIFEPGTPDHVREFERLENGTVVWRLWEKRDQPHVVEGIGETRFYLIDEGTVAIGEIPLVPFITGRRDGRSWRFFPAMRDAADLQVELYQQESGLKFVKTLAAYPMLSGNGVKPLTNPDGSVKKLAVGPGKVLYAPTDASGNAGSWTYVEPGAQTMKFLADDIKSTIDQLRELGRQPLTAQSGNLTVITTAVAAGKAKSAVSAWALGLKDALENAMVLTCKWMNVDHDPVVSVYTDFDEFTEGKDLEALSAARTARDISQETYWHELKRRRVLSDEFDADAERERLLKEVPADDGEDTRDVDAPPE